MNDATKEGASEVKPELSSREQIMAAAVSGRHDELREEGVEIEEVVIPAEDQLIDNEDPNLEGNVDLEVKKEDLDDLPAEEGLIEVKIDGRSETVSPEEIKSYQKGKAADKRLEEAANKKKINEQTERNLAEREASITAQENLNREREDLAAETSEDVEALFEDLTDAVLTEDKEKGVAAIKKLRNNPAPSQPQVSPEEMERQINAASTVAARKIKAKEELAEAQEKFSTQFPELDGSPMMRSSVNTEAKRIFAEDDTQKPWDVLRLAGENVSKEIGIIKKEDIDSTKRDVKRSAAVKQPKAAGTRRAPLGKDDPPPKSRAQVTRSMVEERNAKLS